MRVESEEAKGVLSDLVDVLVRHIPQIRYESRTVEHFVSRMIKHSRG